MRHRGLERSAQHRVARRCVTQGTRDRRSDGLLCHSGGGRVMASFASCRFSTTHPLVCRIYCAPVHWTRNRSSKLAAVASSSHSCRPVNARFPRDVPVWSIRGRTYGYSMCHLSPPTHQHTIPYVAAISQSKSGDLCARARPLASAILCVSGDTGKRDRRSRGMGSHGSRAESGSRQAGTVVAQSLSMPRSQRGRLKRWRAECE